VGPTTLAALLNSLQMGFRTLAIEKRSAEVWSLLGAVKTEFGKFGEVLAKTKKKLEEATNTIGSAEVRTRQIERQLRGVEALPAHEAQPLLGKTLARDEETPVEWGRRLASSQFFHILPAGPPHSALSMVGVPALPARGAPPMKLSILPVRMPLV